MNQESGKPVHALSIEEALRRFETDPNDGLGAGEVESRRREHGSNEIEQRSRRSVWLLFFDQFKSMVVLILAAAGVLAFAFARWAEGVAVVAVILVNTAIGFISEWRATKAIHQLKQAGRRTTRLRRGGNEQDVPVSALVPGDVAVLESGDIAPADIRLVEANGLRVDESALTGESVSVNKRLDPVESDSPLAERTNMVYRGTVIVEGSGLGVVVVTGMATELGRITELASQPEQPSAPLQQRLNKLGARLAWITLGLGGAIALMGLLIGKPTLLIIETSIALAVAAIPEGLPIVATIALARGMWLMARRNAIIHHLPAVETLGATDIILTDKTGTLTENRMTLQRIVTPLDERELDDDAQNLDPRDNPAAIQLTRRAVEIGVLCNNATLSDPDRDDEPDEELGDPTEVALLRAGWSEGLKREEMLETTPEVREESFDPQIMMMATFHEVEDGYDVAVKGAPQAVLNICDRIAGQNEPQSLSDEKREEWVRRADDLAGQGLRMLAVAEKHVDDSQGDPYEKLCFVGLVGLEDPPRPEVRQSIEQCRRAGVRVVMVTGDQAQTAGAIARQTGIAESEDDRIVQGKELENLDERSGEERDELLSASVYARVSPEQKLRLAEALRDRGYTVAMTGDGVNDTPALTAADIGVAMGRRGTDAARRVADMVLKDDAFGTIVAAVRQGRTIFENIRSSVIFMLCTNCAEVIAVAAATAINAPLPLRPLQILYLNVITDVFPALALGVSRGREQVMTEPPRRRHESVLTRDHWLRIGGWSMAIAACVLVGLTVALQAIGFDTARAVTVSFLTLAFAKLGFVFNLRPVGSTLRDNNIVTNRWMWLAQAACVALLLLAVYLPGLSDVLDTRPPGPEGWITIIVLAALPMIAGQALLYFRRPHHERTKPASRAE